MKKIIYSLILFTITALHISCGDFLEVKSDSEFTPKYVESLN